MVREKTRVGSRPFTLQVSSFDPYVYERFGDGRELAGLYGA